MNHLVDQYFDSLIDKKIAVLGIGVSNRPLIRMLLAHGLHVLACDKTPREKLDAEVLELERAGTVLHVGEHYLDDVQADIVFRTPGMHPDIPALRRLREKGAELTSEMEAFFEVCPCRIIAVTGSDGKTTTTTLISKFYEAAGRKVHLGGNIGAALLPMLPEVRPEDVAVVELSSFQLMTMPCSPHIAVMTNLAPNHLDVHKDMAEYVAAKENIFRHQKPGDKAIFNFDNDITRRQGESVPDRAVYFSRQAEPEKGVFLRGDAIVCRDGRGERTVMTTGDIKLPGVHNVENYMAAIAAVDGLVPDETIRDFAREFGGVEHRIELVRTYRGVRYYNDSIASSPSRTTAGLRSFPEKVILIAGGYDKHIPFDALGGEIVEHVKLLVLCGATAAKIRTAVENAEGYQPGHPEIVEVTPFQKAVETARDRAVPGDVVTLSPACAAFDQFKNFAERGKTFKAIVNSWAE